MPNPRKRRLKKLAIMLAVTYASTWVPTARGGGPQLVRRWLGSVQEVPQAEADCASGQLQQHERHRQHLLEKLRTSDDASFVEAMRSRNLEPTPPGTYPSFTVEATCVAPFIVVVESGRVLAPLSGSRRSAIRVWFFGLTLVIASYGHWAA